MQACRELAFFPRAAILGWRYAEVLAEAICHVGMIGKATLGRNVRQSPAARNNHVGCTLHPDVANIFTDRRAIASAERSRKMRRMHSCNMRILRDAGGMYNVTRDLGMYVLKPGRWTAAVNARTGSSYFAN